MSDRFWWHLVNDNRGEDGKKGSALKAGRFILHLGRLELSWEWHFGDLSCRLRFNTGDEGDVSIGLALPLIALFFSLEHTALYKILPKQPRTTGIAIHDWTVWFDIWQRQNEWDTKRDMFTHFTFCIPDFFLGRDKYTSRTLSIERVTVPMPEGDYPATVNVFESTWTRPRWPWPKRMVRCEIKPDKPIPKPGKGENSWDCDEDATYSLTTPADTAGKAVLALINSVMRDREKYGGRNWKPAAKGT